MALLEDALGGWTGGALLGIGAAVVAPSIIPAAGSILRPVVKVLVRGGLVVTESVRGVVAEASERVTDLVAEVRAESDARSSRGRTERRSTPSSLHPRDAGGARYRPCCGRLRAAMPGSGSPPPRGTRRNT